MLKQIVFSILICGSIAAQDSKSTTTTPPPAMSREQEIKETKFVTNSFTLDEKEAEMSLGVNNGLVLYLPLTSNKEVEKNWKEYIKNQKGKVKESKNEVSTLQMTVPTISKNPLDIYSISETYNSGTNQVVFINLGTDFISKAKFPTEFEKAREFLFNFGLFVQQNQIKNELEKEEDALKKLTKEEKKLVNQNEGYHDDIERYKKLIKEAEENIEKNVKEQANNKVDQKNKEFDIEYVKWKLKSFPIF